ncbi:hypothetical protein [Streptomyces phaeoluteigriseus]|uniref:hypothetical protein n=1 Tax=Streptomyces phaeoluteigriseus TaxID=114686 RepID=UPI0036A5656C
MSTSQPQATPAVFMFQPTEFEDVPVERLDEWEQDLREYVGLDLESATLRNGVSRSTSRSPKKDDCDTMAKEQ